MNGKIDAFSENVSWITELLYMYEINTEDPDVQQNIINANVCINNAYNGFDSEGNKVGVVGEEE